MHMDLAQEFYMRCDQLPRKSRMSVVGKASTLPLVEQPTTAEERARNRRVEININQGEPIRSKPISVLDQPAG